MFFCSNLSSFWNVTVGFALFLTNSRLHFRGRAMIISFSCRAQLLVWVSALHCAIEIEELHAGFCRDDVIQITAECFRPSEFRNLSISVSSVRRKS